MHDNSKHGLDAAFHLHRAKASHLLHNLIFCYGSTGFSLAVKMKIKAFLCLGGQQLTSSVLQMPFIGVRAIPHTPSVYQDPAAPTTASQRGAGQNYSTSVSEQTGVHSQNVTLRAVRTSSAFILYKDPA